MNLDKDHWETSAWVFLELFKQGFENIEEMINTVIGSDRNALKHHQIHHFAEEFTFLLFYPLWIIFYTDCTVEAYSLRTWETNGKGFWSPLQDIKPYELYKIGDQIILS